MKKKNNMRIIFNNKILIATTLFWFVIQILYIKTNKYDILVSDPGLYVYYAQECVKHGTMYPDYTNYHDQYIFNPGWVNFIILWIKLFGSVRYLPYFNSILNLGIIYYIFQICKKLFSNGHIAYTAAYCFMLLPSFFTISSHLYSESLFTILSLATLYYTITSGTKIDKVLPYIAGSLAALSMWTRPIALAWMIACLFYYLWIHRKWFSAIKYIGSYAIICTIIAICTHINYPDYLYKANTGGVNIIMGANDLATGGYCGETRYNKGELGYINGLFTNDTLPVWRYYTQERKEPMPATSSIYTSNELDKIWKERALTWIMNNPIHFIRLSFTKIEILFKDSPTFLYKYEGSGRIYTYNNIILPFVSMFGNTWHYIGLILSFIGLFRKKLYLQTISVIYIPIILYIIMICITCASSRYNMVIQPLIVISATVTLKRIFTKLSSITLTHNSK